MEDMILAIKNKDLVEVKKLFSEGMKEKTNQLIEAEKLKLCQNIVVEGEENDDSDEDDNDGEQDTKDNKDTKETDKE